MGKKNKAEKKAAKQSLKDQLTGSMPALSDFTYTGEGSFKLSDFPTSCNVDPQLEEAYAEKLAKSSAKMAKLQDKLFAAREEGVLFLTQAMDAAGKDSTVEHVLKGLNPALVPSFCFKTPTKEELAHDYMWRAHVHLPERGSIGVFNRSYYEDVLVVRVLGIWTGYSWPKRCCDMSEQEFFDMRFRQIANYEQYLYENGYRLVKIFLNVSKEEQKNRFIARIDTPEKNWKFSAGDLDTRASWDKYMECFEDMIDKTSTPENPWYVIPADQKFVARLLTSQALLETLKDINPQYPVMSEEDLAEMAECRERLLAE